MSLNADYRNIEGRSKLFDEKNQLRPKAYAVVMMTMLVGMGEITKKNFQEFYRRACMAEAVSGALCQDSKGPCYITLEDVRQMIGLKTNVFPSWPPKKFEAHVAKIALARCVEKREGEEASTHLQKAAKE